MTNGDPPEYSIRTGGTGKYRVLRNPATPRERGLHYGNWFASVDAEQRWTDAVDAAAALVAQLVREKFENGPAVSRP